MHEDLTDRCEHFEVTITSAEIYHNFYGFGKCNECKEEILLTPREYETEDAIIYLKLPDLLFNPYHLI